MIQKSTLLKSAHLSLGPVHTPNFRSRTCFELFRPAELSQTPILIPAALNSKGEKCSFRGQTAQKTRYNLRIR